VEFEVSDYPGFFNPRLTRHESSDLEAGFGILSISGGLYPASPKLYDFLVSLRRPLLFVLSMLLAGTPLLTCLPTPAMTDAEMACCKKMAGNCDMGAGKHSCCKTTVNVSQLAVAISEIPQVHLPDSMVAIPILLADVKVDFTSEGVRATHTPRPISPPGSQSILRI
jgi:hypothetical protein